MSDKQKILDALLYSILFLVVCWGVFLLTEYLEMPLKRFGMHPRSTEGLVGIVSMHFLHADWKHLLQNSMGFLVLNSFLFYFYRSISLPVFLLLFFISPLVLWVFGRPENHIGASALIYAEFGFLAISGIIRRNPILLRVSLTVLLYYGSLVWYILPIDPTISYEGHASGLVVGVACAIYFRKRGPQRKTYQYELEPELPDDENAYWKIPDHTANSAEQSGRNQSSEGKEQTTISVKYEYKENGKRH